MKQTCIILFSILTLHITYACGCDYKTFITASKKSELIVKAKVLKHNYYNREKQSISKEQIDQSEYFGHSIFVEVLEVIKGKESRKTFEIYGGLEWEYATDCKTKINQIEVGKTYVFSLVQSSESNHSQPNENQEDYSLYACQESYVEYIEDLDSVKGVLKGQNLNKKRIISYEKLKRKITSRTQIRKPSF